MGEVEYECVPPSPTKTSCTVLSTKTIYYYVTIAKNCPFVLYFRVFNAEQWWFDLIYLEMRNPIGTSLANRVWACPRGTRAYNTRMIRLTLLDARKVKNVFKKIIIIRSECTPSLYSTRRLRVVLSRTLSAFNRASVSVARPRGESNRPPPPSDSNFIFFFFMYFYTVSEKKN